MGERRIIHLLGFGAHLEREAVDGVAYLRIDEGTAAGQVRRAHAALEEKLAMQEPLDSDLVPGRRVRVLGMMHDIGEQVLRVKVEVV